MCPKPPGGVILYIICGQNFVLHGKNMDLFFDISEKHHTFALANAERRLVGKSTKPLEANKAGCSSVRLEYTSGGREVAGSNPVTPTFIRET